ncbi:4-hydroxy-tetrahydrodipicolinate reductase [Saccharicrinis fermentans]|uniref:4-hydroxy-tetrahydrodipicolinate reductase n=1 Tax=Saccharicrinis fermentans DSM 9555 = JCM 21142 TaxID=869213 RepID=W7YKR4_9BACT|nr:4-hydroxy-tetrahydrodipicolinate reductase [Saccharicrinis fermentans]GAF05101.1 dihydrodipicolinate reductase [Saccharicrinis fermentans DSM 9555 = JCM 21142]
MNIALIGYGKMGKEIEKIAQERGHNITARIDMQSGDAFDGEGFAAADVAIEFTMPAAAYGNYMECFKRNKPVVSGTTGWLDKLNDIKEQCENKGQTFFYASNFSVGVNVFFEINKKLAQLMNGVSGYEVSMEETHHIHKKDSPSGTAITLAEGIIDQLDGKTGWTEDQFPKDNEIQIEAFRREEVPGIHTVIYDSEVDEIIIHHSAKSRKGFALGAVLAAEFTAKNKGFLGMGDMLKF